MKRIIISMLVVITGISIYAFTQMKNTTSAISLPNLQPLVFTKKVLSNDILERKNEKTFIKITDYKISGGKMIKTPDNGFCVLANASKGQNIGILLVKFSENKELQWGHIYESVGQSAASKIFIDNNKNFIILGQSKVDLSLVNAFILKITSNGEVIWTKGLGKKDVANDFKNIISIDDGYIAVGNVTKGFNVTFKNNRTHIKAEKLINDIWIVKIDNNGKTINENIIEDNINSFAVEIQPKHNDYIVYVAPASSPKELIVNKDGNILSSKDIKKLPVAIDEKYKNKYLAKKIVYKTIVVEKSNKDKFIIKKLSENKSVLWEYEIKKSGNRGDSVNLIETVDGGCIINNFQYSFLQGSTFLIKLDKDGKERWKKHYTSENGRFIFNDTFKVKPTEFLFLATKTFIEQPTISTEKKKNTIESKFNVKNSKSGLVLIDIKDI